MTVEGDALRQLSENMRAIAEIQREMRAEATESRRTLVDIQMRVTRIESNRLDSMVAKLETKLDGAISRLDVLESDRDRREGAIGFVGWLTRNAPWMAALVLGVLAYLGWERPAVSLIEPHPPRRPPMASIP